MNEVSLREVVATTMRNRTDRGKSYNPGALQRIVNSARDMQDKEAIINRMTTAFRLEEADRLRSYWGA